MTAMKTRSYWHLISCLIALASSLGCADRGASESRDTVLPPTTSNSAVPPNGVYAVLREANCQTDAASNRAKQMVLIYDRKNASRDADPSPQYVAIDPDDYVPLIIDGAAKIGSDSDGKSMLSVTLARENVAKLEAFTRSHLGGKVANVIGGQIVTLHKVRAVIPDGQLQITRCEDDACRMIWSELSPWPTITDIDGHRHQPFEQPDVKAVVMVFVLADCPIAKQAIPR